MKENKNGQDKCLFIDKSIPIKQYKDLENKSVKDLIFKENRNMCGIYKRTNLINGNFYIGSSVNLIKRFIKYFNNNLLTKNNMLINKAIIKYGHKESLKKILEYCSPKDVIKREQYYLYLLKPKYNILKIAGYSYGYKHNEASLMKTRVLTEKTLNKMKARIQSKETKAKISKTLGIPVLVIDTHTQTKKI